MRSLSANALAKLEEDFGNEPILVVEVVWGGQTASEFYADRSIPEANVVGRIREVSGLDEALQVSGGAQSQQITVKLDDFDGHIKAIFDAQDVHKRKVRLWQWFAGLDWSDRFLVFTGQINSPVIWSEGERTFSLTVVNRIEDAEVGFSAEEGAFPSLPEELIGKPWPLCFGKCINVPALRAVPAVNGTLATGVGIKDFTLPARIALANKITCPQSPIGFRCTNFFGGGGICTIVFEPDGDCLQARCHEIERLNFELADQQRFEYKVFTVYGGKNFPQSKTITLNINGGKFTGFFNGTDANPSETFTCTSRLHPRNDGSNRVKQDAAEQFVESKCSGIKTDQDSNFTPSAFGPLWTGVRDSRVSWQNYRKYKAADFFWAEGGSRVTLDGDNGITYIANILPSTILSVKAYRTVNGNRFLLSVPSAFYTLQLTDYIGYQVSEVVFQRPLSRENQEEGGGWEDDIFVTLISSVGPNTVDILRWFIETYTEFEIDEPSFGAARPQLENYPMHFPLLVRKNIITVLQEIANKARCALYLKNDKFYIKYLSYEPTPVDVITEFDILRDEEDPQSTSLSIELTKTEDLVTKLTAKWRVNYALPSENTLILRHNMHQYGTHDRTDDYYQFNILDLVRKSATFWLIRYANTWKRVKFSTPLRFLNLEANDAITLDLPDVASVPITAIVEKATYDSASRRINFEVWTPVKAGTMKPYDFAWPANISELALWPTEEERQLLQAGSGNEPNFSTVAPPTHPLRFNRIGVYSGISLKCNGDAQPIKTAADSSKEECRQDHGDKKPSDKNDEKPEPPANEDSTGDVSTGSSPVTNGSGKGYFGAENKLKDQANQNENNGYKNKQEQERANDKNGTNNPTNDSGDDLKDKLNSLPEPEELDDEDYPCKVVVSTSYFARKPAVGNVCVPSGNNVFETYVFNSCEAAKSFAASMASGSDCSNQPPCDIPCKNATISKFCTCEPPEGEEPGLIGYKGDPGGGDPIAGL